MKIAYVIPSAMLSGGTIVVLQHYNNLISLGHEVDIYTQDNSSTIDWRKDIPVTPINDIDKKTQYDFVVATFWTTLSIIKRMKAKRRLYFVQSDERNFYHKIDDIAKVQKTYETEDVEFVTMAKWIQGWLLSEFGKETYYVPNGIDLKLFNTRGRHNNEVPRYLIEGKVHVPSKGVAEAYKVLEEVGCEKWMISGDSDKPSAWQLNRFFSNLTQKKMADVYRRCDVLLKMSRVESFSLPPLEMMACGGTVIMRRVTGIEDYAIDGFNCLIIDNYQEAKAAVKKLLTNKDLLSKLQINGIETAKEWSVDNQRKYLDIIFGRGEGPQHTNIASSYKYLPNNSTGNYSKHDLLQSLENHKEYIIKLEKMNSRQAIELDKLNKIVFAIHESRIWKLRNGLARLMRRGRL